MRKLLKEPLLHFFLLGGALFALYLALNRDALRAPDEIVVDQTRLDALARQYATTWGRQPDRAELRAAVDSWVREEVLFRQGVQAGLEQDDTVVRRRVVQKMQFMAEGMTASRTPSNDELQAWLDAHADEYRIPPRYAFSQVFFDRARHAGHFDTDLRRARVQLASDPAAAVGDATQLPATMPLVSTSEITRVFGQHFTDAITSQPEGRWSGPVESAYGVHLVRIEQHQPGRVPELAEVRNQIEQAVAHQRDAEAADAFYAALRQRYTVKLEGDFAEALATSAHGMPLAGMAQP